MWIRLLLKLADVALPIIISAVLEKLKKEKGFIPLSEKLDIEKAQYSHNRLKYLLR
jgi:hypothetical protein